MGRGPQDTHDQQLKGRYPDLHTLFFVCLFCFYLATYGFQEKHYPICKIVPINIIYVCKCVNIHSCTYEGYKIKDFSIAFSNILIINFPSPTLSSNVPSYLLPHLNLPSECYHFTLVLLFIHLFIHSFIHLGYIVYFLITYTNVPDFLLKAH